MTIHPAAAHSEGQNAGRDGTEAVLDPVLDPALDHLVYATPDMRRSLAEFQHHTSIAPAPGGRHVGLGTRNYLVALGPRRYLEIVGPDTDHPPEVGATMPFGIGELTDPGLVTWAVHPDEPERAVAAAREAGADLGELRAMSRARPDGTLLEWRLALPDRLPLDGMTPFVIDWGDTPHPAAGGLPAAELVDMSATHPTPGAVRRVCEAMGVSLPVDRGSAALRAVIATPRGIVELG